MKTEIQVSRDGSHTLYVPELSEHYHSIHGAISESVHVFIRNGFLKIPLDPIIIFEMGFGTGLNVLITLLENMRIKKTVVYHSLDAYPLDKNIWTKLNYPDLLSSGTAKYFNRIHETPWDKSVEIAPGFELLKIRKDMHEFTPAEKYDLIYYDAFAPGKQPGMWEISIFKKIYRMMNSGGILTTYSSKSLIRRRLEEAGLQVTKLDGPAGKKHITMARKK